MTPISLTIIGASLVLLYAAMSGKPVREILFGLFRGQIGGKGESK